MRDRFVSIPSAFDDRFQLAQLHFGERQQDVIFARKVVEKCAFTNIGGVSDVFHRGIGEAILSEQIQSSTKQAFANLRRTPLSTIRSGN
jgi:hypothetical protein